MNANEYYAWMMSKPKATRSSDPVRAPIMPGTKLRQSVEKDKFEGFRAPSDRRIEPEYV